MVLKDHGQEDEAPGRPWTAGVLTALAALAVVTLLQPNSGVAHAHQHAELNRAPGHNALRVQNGRANGKRFDPRAIRPAGAVSRPAAGFCGLDGALLANSVPGAQWSKTRYLDSFQISSKMAL
nr:hypothetical protein GCM10017745_45840 [Saccharothrix mutabilis subsp. capreolus]